MQKNKPSRPQKVAKKSLPEVSKPETLVDENDLVGQMIKFTKINLNIGLIFITRPSIQNCLRYLKTLK